MKNCIFSFLFILFFVTSTFSAQQQPSNPTLVFFVNHQDQPKKDYVEITLQIQAKDTSLTSVINGGASTVQQISNLAKEFCSQNSKKKTDCKDIVDAGKFEVEPRYQLIRKQPVFMGFTVKHEMTIAVKSVENIGHLVDKILTKSGITLQNFEWKALEQPKTHEDAIAQGMQQGQGLCAQLGLKLGRVISIEEVNESQAETQEAAGQQEGQGEDEDEQGQDQNTSVFRFEVECAGKSKEKKE